MNHTKTNISGVDIRIQKIQDFIFEKMDNGNFNAYGRVYKIEKDNNTIPCWYVSDREYKEVLLSDRLDGSFFFNIGDFQKVSLNGDMETDCDILFSVNLTTLKGQAGRQDENIVQDVIEYLQKFRGIFNITEVVRGLDNVYSDFSGVSNYFKDLQPYFHFKVKGNLLYNINIKCTN